MPPSFNLERVPVLVATYLPVEICVYYQVVPLELNGSSLKLGMVDTADQAAQDYVGRMLKFSQLEVQPESISFQEHQDIIAYCFSHPPDPSELAQSKAAQQNQLCEELEAESEAEASIDEVQSPAESTQLPAPTLPPKPTAPATQDSPPEGAESVKQLLNSMLRRALDEKGDRLFIEVNDNHTCRVRYRQQGILRDLFKELSDPIRANLIMLLKQMVGLDPVVHNQPQSAKVERTYRSEPIVLDLQIVIQQNREGAILNILHGEAFTRYQANQTQAHTAEVIQLTKQAQMALLQLHQALEPTLDNIEKYSVSSCPELDELHQALCQLAQTAEQVKQLQSSLPISQNTPVGAS